MAVPNLGVVSFPRHIFHQQPDRPKLNEAAKSVKDVAPAVLTEEALRQPLKQKNTNQLLESKLTTKHPISRAVKDESIRPREISGADKIILGPKFTGITKPWKQNNILGSVARISPPRKQPLKKSLTGQDRCINNHHPKTTPRKKITRPSTNSKKLSRPEHPSFLALQGKLLPHRQSHFPTITTEASTAYLIHTSTHLSTHFATAIADISAALERTTLQSQNLISTAAAANRALTLPIEDEALLIREPAGHGSNEQQKIRTTIGERMAVFEKFLDAKTVALRELWGRWNDVTHQIESLVLQDDDGAGGSDASEARQSGHYESPAGGFAAKYREVEESYCKQRDAILDRLGNECGELSESVTESELNFEKERKEQQRQVLELIRRQMEEEEDE